MSDSEDSKVTNDADSAPRSMRADARRSKHALLEAAKTVFATSGVDAPVREIACEAGVGVGTLYRHFPKRSDLVAEVFRREVDACAAAAPALAEKHPPCVALEQWLYRYTDFIATKNGLAAALRSGDPAYDALPAYFREHFGPAIASLLDAAASAGVVRADIDAEELLQAATSLCMNAGENECTSANASGDAPSNAQRMVALLVDGLRYGARGRSDTSV